MYTSEWLDRIACNLLHLEHDLRTALRCYGRGQQHARLAQAAHYNGISIRAHSGISINVHEVRTLLHGAMPAPIATTKLRAPHARLLASLTLYSRHLVSLNDPAHPIDTAIAAALQLAGALDDWLCAARWLQATRRARVNWPMPRDVTKRSIRGIMRQPPPAAPERAGNIDGATTPNPHAGALHHPAAGLRWLHQLRTEQLALDLAPPPSAELVDLRQLHLQLAPRAVA